MKTKAEKIGESILDRCTRLGLENLSWLYTLDGTNYNEYLVFGNDKIALIDNVYPGKTEELMARVDNVFVQEGKTDLMQKLMLLYKTI